MIQRLIAGVAMTSVLGCGAEQDLSGSEPVEASSDEIVSGSTLTKNYFNVAVYHRTAGVWFERPCSGTLVGTVGGYAFVLTAYHCVNESPATDIRLTTALAPGKVAPGGQPPAGTVTPHFVYTPSDASVDVPGRDYAVVVAPDTATLKSGISASDVWLRPAFTVGTSADFLNRTVRAYGYGRFVLCTSANGPECEIEDANSGAGVLRSGGAFPITSTSTSQYKYTNGSGTAVAVTHGDSGGPSVFSYVFQTPPPQGDDDNYEWRIFTGVHSTAGEGSGYDASNPNVPKFLQSLLGRFYVTCVRGPGGFLRRASETSGAAVSANSPSSDSKSAWFYDYTTKQLRSGNLCLRAPSSTGSSVTIATCSTSTSQKWTHTKDLQLKNTAYGTCAAYSSGNVVTRSCAIDAEQAWVFRIDPDAL